MIRALSATGNLGYGFPAASLEAALAEDLTFLGSDAGSTDPGPYYLGAGEAFVSRAACKRDVRLLLNAAIKYDLPLVFGSAGGSGSAKGVRWLQTIVEEVAAEDSLSFTMATVLSDVEEGTIRRLLGDDRVKPLDGGASLESLETASLGTVVAMMGPEPIQAAIEQGAQVVVAGRCSDAALFAAIPMLHGVPPDVAWHAGKIIECGAAIAVPKSSDCMVATMDGNGFDVRCPNPAKEILRANVAAHSMYENADGFLLREPGGVIDASSATFTQLDPRRVRVAGARFRPSSEYTVKLEGAALVGFRSIAIAGTRDPGFIAQFDSFTAAVRSDVERRAADIVEAGAQYSLHFRTYGSSGVMAEREPDHSTPHELGIVIDVVASSQGVANEVLALARTLVMHSHFDGRLCNAGNLAFPFSPSDLEAPAVYRFTLNHVATLEHPLELFPIHIRKVGPTT